jgi:hypothetical protein
MFVFGENRTYFKANIKLDISYQEISSFIFPVLLSFSNKDNNVLLEYV